MRTAALVTLTLLLLGAVQTKAWAQGAAQIDEGVRLYENADLEGALVALATAEDGSLTRSDLLRLLLTRSLVRFGLGEFGSLERDLLAIACIEPDYDLGVRAPPPLANAFERAKARVEGPLSVAVELEGMPGGVRLLAATHGDRAGIVERVLIAARPAGSNAPFSRGDGGSLTLPVASGGEVEVYAAAIGPGGAVIATDGTEDQPRRAVVPEPATDLADAESGSFPVVPVVVGIGIGVAVVTAVAVVLAVVLSGSSGTQPIGPVVER